MPSAADVHRVNSAGGSATHVGWLCNRRVEGENQRELGRVKTIAVIAAKTVR